MFRAENSGVDEPKRKLFNSVFLLGMFFAAGLWFFEALVHVYIFNRGNIVSELIPKDPHEAIVRSTFFIIVVVSSIVIQVIVNKQREAERATADAFRKLQDITEAVPDIIYTLDLDGKLVNWNSRASSVTGYSNEELNGKYVLEFFHEEEHSAINEAMLTAYSTGFTATEGTLLCKDGSRIPYHWTGAPLKDSLGNVRGLVGIGRDLTQHKQIEKELQETVYKLAEEKSKSEAILAAIGDGIAIVDTDFKIIYQNQAYKNTFGDHTGKYCFRAFCNAEAVCDGCPVLASFDSGEIIMQGRVMQTARGSICVEVTASPLMDSAGRIIAGIKVVRDITGRKQSEEFTKLILESMVEGLVVIDTDYRVIAANKAYCDQVKRPLSDIVGKHCYDVSHHITKPCFEAGEECAPKHTFSTGEPHTIVHVHRDQKGRPVYVETKSYPIRNSSGEVTSVIEVLNDITEKRNLEEQLLQSQKLEAIGTLAGGIAHDFNNYLTTIIGYADLSQKKLGHDDPAFIYLNQVLAASERAAHLTQSLLAFGRKKIINPKPLNLNDAIRKVESLMLRLITEEIELKLTLADRELTVMVDDTQLEQVLMNLVTNARDAISGRGAIIISTDVAEFDDAYIKAHGYGKHGTYAVLTVSDTGQGLDEEVKQKIFEPFYTTKEVGKGTGLGLSMVYGIIKQHNGFINVYSESGKGSSFKIYLPLVKRKAQKTEVVARPAPVGGTETILVAEDDSSVRSFLADVLQSNGYTVIEAEDGEAALKVFRAKGADIHLVLLDVIMPKMNGKEAYDELKKMRPDVRVIFTSGYTADFIHKKGIVDESLHFISKPISVTDLLRKAREVIDSKPFPTI